jgi:hypothetical protein
MFGGTSLGTSGFACHCRLGTPISASTTGGSFTIPAEAFPNQPGPGVSSSIRVAFPGFTLTALDTVEVPFNITVTSIPEPASAVLVGVGLVIGLVMGLRRSRIDTRGITRQPSA